MHPLSDNEYLFGPAAILQTPACYSYVLSDDCVYWCVQWNPGFVCISFSPRGEMKWAAMRSPNPEFGGRVATDEEIEAFDEQVENPQYNLVYRAWDAQFDEERQTSWHPATQEQRSLFEAAIARVNKLSEQINEPATADKSAHEKWFATCKQSPIWKGEIAMG